MDRKEAIKVMGLMFGGTVFGLQACRSGNKQNSGDMGHLFTEANKKLLNEVGETIIPATDSGGAKKANVAGFMQTIVSDFYTKEEQQLFAGGIPKLKEKSKSKFNASFPELSTAQKKELLMDLEQESAEAQDNRHYYTMIKQLTVWGFLTSEVAAKEVFDHARIPGEFKTCVDYEPADRAMYPRATREHAARLADRSAS